jgi:type VI secretion system protein ImpF
MPQVKPDQPLVASVLDRLIDYEPAVSREPPRKRTQVLRELKQSVRRDLEDLLNTRIRCLALPPGLDELKQSLVNYGIPDLTGAPVGSSKEREEFCRTLQGIIRQHERRFKTVKVQLLEQSEPIDRTLRFRIDALLQAEPAPEPIVFDSNFLPATGTFEVKGEAHE